MTQTEMDNGTLTSANLSTGTVVRTAEGGTYRILLREGEEMTARRADGCHLDPSPGDLVALGWFPGEGLFVLAVLLRSRSGPAPLSFPSGVSFSVSEGPCTVDSPAGMVVKTQEFALVGEKVEMTFGRGRIAFRSLELLGVTLSFAADAMDFVSRIIKTSAGKILTRARTSVRETEAFDFVKSGQSVVETESLFSVRAKSALIHARDLVKVDSENIHLG